MISVPNRERISEYSPEIAKALVDGLTQFQAGTGTLVAGVSAAIAATITSTSNIYVFRKDKASSTALGHLSAPSADRSVGAPGSFKVRALAADTTAETGDLSTFDWLVIG